MFPRNQPQMALFPTGLLIPIFVQVRAAPEKGLCFICTSTSNASLGVAMDLDDVNFDDLPEDPAQAFLVVERALWQNLADQMNKVSREYWVGAQFDYTNKRQPPPFSDAHRRATNLTRGSSTSSPCGPMRDQQPTRSCRLQCADLV